MTPDLAAQIRSHRPAGAKAYFLWQFDQRFPSSGGFALEPITVPFALPPGEYRIGFLADPVSNQQLAPNNPANPAPTITITADAGAALALGKSAPAEKAPKPPPPADPLLNDPDHHRHRVEWEAIRMADQTVKNKALLPRAGMRTREIGEGFVLNRAYRQEHEQLLRTVGNIQQQSLDMSRKTLDFVQESAERMMAVSRQAPPPPPDHVTPFVGLVTTAIKTFGGAFEGRRSKRKGDPVLDALVGRDEDDEDEESDTGAESPELRAARAELAKVKKQLAKRRRGQSDDQASRSEKGKRKAANTRGRQKSKSKSTAADSKPNSGGTKSKRRSQPPPKDEQAKGEDESRALPAKGGDR